MNKRVISMNGKIFTKLIIILMIPILFNFANVQYVYAEDDEPPATEEKTVDNIIEGANSFLDAGKDGISVKKDELKDTSNVLYNLLLGVGMVAAVVVGLILGIKFMVTSVNERAEIKNALIAYVVGCIVVFGAFGIWKLAIQIFNQF